MRRQVHLEERTIEYELTLTKRRSIECRVTANGVKVFAPIGMRPAVIDEMVLQRSAWILESLSQLKIRQERLRADCEIKNGTIVPIEGCQYTVELRPRAKPHLEEHRIILPATDHPAETLKPFLVELARARLTERVAFYAPRVGCSPGRITIREQKTRWGSCSGKGNLNFNWKLIMAPPAALDYVVIHELCHLHEFNHSPAFWARVRLHCPDYAVWKEFLAKGWPHPFP